MKAILGLPRFLLLSLSLLLFIAALSTAFSSTVSTSSVIISVTLFGGIFFFLKRSRFLLPTDEFSDSVREVMNKAGRQLSDSSKTWAKQQVRQWKDKREFIAYAKTRSGKDPLEIVVLGGVDWNDRSGAELIVSVDRSNIYIGDPTTLKEKTISLELVSDIEISGPGTVTSNAGMVGGGFGGEGALAGIGIATVVNLLTTHSSTKTFIRIAYGSSELICLTSKLEPHVARIYFSQIFIAAKKTMPEQNAALLISAELERLAELKHMGHITEDEFLRAKSKILNS